MAVRIPVTVAPARGCDCASCALYVGNPAALEPVCSGSNTDCSYCGCARTADLTVPDCGECPIRCGSRVDIAAWMTDIGSTVAFDDLTAAGQYWPDAMPRFVPQLDTTTVEDLDAGLGWPAYAIGLRRVFSPRTATILPTFQDTTAAAAMGLPDGCLSMLVGYGEDPLVEAFWTRRHDLFPQLAINDWSLLLAPNFSMYGNQPRAEHLINFRRNLAVCEELLAAGVNAAPNLYWFRLEDLTRYADWARDVDPAVVAINLQTFRTDADWEQMAMPGLTWLADALPATTRLVAVGTSRVVRLGQLVALWGERLVVVSQNPIQYARHGAVMTAEGRVDVHADVAVAFASSVRFYAATLGAST